MQVNNIIFPPGWRSESNGHYYKCRVCHRDCSAHVPAISSPNYAFYHLHCVEKSPSYQRDLKKMLQKNEKETKHL